MPEKFLTVPVSALDGNNLPNNLTGAILSATTSVTGLTNGTAYRTFVLQNPSPSFTPAAASLSITFVDEGSSSSVISSTGSWTYSARDLSAIPEGGEIILAVRWRGASGPSADIGTPTIGGTSTTLINVGGTDAKTTNQRSRSALYRVARPAGSGTFDVAIPWSSGTISGSHYELFYIQNRVADVALFVSTSFNNAPGTIDTDAGGGLIFSAGFENATADGTFSGATLAGTWKNAANMRGASATATGTTDENRSISIANPANTDADCRIVLSMR